MEYFMKNKRDVKTLFYRRVGNQSLPLALKVLLNLGTETASVCFSDLFTGKHADLVAREILPSSYSNPEDFRRDYLAVELMSKFPYLDLGIDRAAVAIRKFMEAEQQCLYSNQRLSERRTGSLLTALSCDSVIWTARMKISSLLGDFSWDECERYFGFGPGATTALKRKRGDAYHKYKAAKPHVTEGCSVLAYTAVRRIPTWFSSLASTEGVSLDQLLELPVDHQIARLFKLVPGNRVTTVPKSAKTDRTIAIEPCMNMFIQKGIGGVLRSRLKRVGVDLDDQRRNQVMSLEGSLNGNFSTIDLASASDTVSMRLVEELLPCDWVTAIKQCRSPGGTLPDGTFHLYQKVSSMGNGFTFELESLIFWALCSSVISLFKPRERRFAVYGDDIVFPVECTGTLLWMLDFCGFTPNRKKTFVSGPFRESCGKHYFRGIDVTPFYIRENIDTVERLLWFCNRVSEWSSSTLGFRDCTIKAAYDLGVTLLPRWFRKPRVPIGYGDVSLIGDFDECTPPYSRRMQCFLAVGVSQKQLTRSFNDTAFLLRQLASLEKEAPSGAFPRKTMFLSELAGGCPRGVVHNSHAVPGIVQIPVAQWVGHGPWVDNIHP
jgi:hypothetical protein